MLKIKQYVKAASLEEAYELNQKKANVIIGGMHWLKMSRRSKGTAIDLSGLGLDEIIETEESFEIGCMTTLRQLELHEGLNAYTAGAVRDSVKDIVGVQFRNTATIGGSIFGRFGFSDVLTVFMAMDAYVVCYKAGEIPIREYAAMKADRDILVKIVVKKKPISIAYLAQRHARTDFPILTCAVSCLDGKWCAVVGAKPTRAEAVVDETGIISGITALKETSTEAGTTVLGKTSTETGTVALEKTPTEAEAAAFGKYVADQLTFGSNMRASGEYRKQIAAVLVKRALLSAGKEK